MLGAYTIWHFLAFMAIVVVCLWVDLHAHKADQPISMRNALLWSIFWIALACAFGVYVGVTHGIGHASLYFSGYLLEKSLSVDNLFVIMAIFGSFSIKDQYQHRVLYYGIVGALVLSLLATVYFCFARYRPWQIFLLAAPAELIVWLAFRVRRKP